MAIHLMCTACRKTYTIDDGLRGKKVRCTGCNGILLVPGGAPAPAATAVAAKTMPPRPEPTVRAQPATRPPAPPTPAKARGNLVPVLLIGGGVGCLGVLLLGSVLVVGLVVALRPRGDSAPPVAAAAQAVAQDPVPRAVPAAVPAAGAKVAVNTPPPAPRVEVPAGPAPAQLDPAALARVKHATVYLRVGLPNGGLAQGSGFFCGGPGLIMTNAHVLGMLSADAPPPLTVEVAVNSGEPDELKLVGSVLGVDRSNDLAVLRVQGDVSRLPAPLPVDSATKLSETQKVYVFGFPLGSQLGKNITVSESSVSSLRRDDTGRLAKVQVNGGMQPGNSGGPVTDTRGVVVGVSVSIIVGTQINFAIAGDLVNQVLDGQVVKAEPGSPYLANNRTALPVQLTALDPLGRVRDVKVEVWTGGPGKPRAGGPAAPAQAGDGPRQAFPAAARDGGYAAEVTLPPAEPGKVYWLQPVCVNGAGARFYGPATSAAPEELAPLERRPALIRFQPAADPVERTLRLNSAVTITIVEGNDRAVLTEKMDGTVLESLWRDQRGIGTAIRLTLADCPFTRELSGKTVVPPPQAKQMLSQFAPTFLVDGTNATKERGKRNFTVLPQTYQGTVESMYESVCNTYEATTLPVPNRELRPQETWQAKLPQFVKVKDRWQIHDIFLTCTYEGVRSAAGHNDAVASLVGVVKSRGAGARVLGKVKGQASFDTDRGFLSRVKVTVVAEAENEDAGVRVLVSNENKVVRTDGNPTGIKAATVNQPAAPARPPR
jgi:S1-C subfamily serine protease